MILNWFDEITIVKVQNWYVIKREKDDTDGIDTNLVVHINENDWDDEQEAEQEALLDLFYKLQDFFGVYNSKHNKTRLEMSVVQQKDDD